MPDRVTSRGSGNPADGRPTVRRSTDGGQPLKSQPLKSQPPKGQPPKGQPQTTRGQVLKTKAEKRLEAKATKARIRAAKKRRRVLTIVGAAVVVLALIVGLVWLISRPSHSTPTAGASATPAAAQSSAAFPPLPAGADPALATKPKVTAGTGTITKLTPTTLIEGKGAATQAGQTIDVNYVGVTYADGKEFDSSWSRSQPLSFQLGAGKVIPGWDQGLVGVKVGSRVQLDIPADLAYGTNPTGGQPAGTLRFVVDVLSAA